MSLLIEYLNEKKIKFKQLKIRSKHKKNNKHNYTYIKNGNDTNGITIGNYTYGELNYIDYKCGCKLIIGSFCSIAQNVTFLMGGNHNYKSLSTFPFEHYFEEKRCSISKGDIIVEDDVWIGYGCIILSGVTIGKGAVVAAGTIITKDVPPYSIVAGRPQKIIKKRFSDDVIARLMKIDYSVFSKEDYIKHKSIYLKNLDSADALNEIERLFLKEK